MHAAGCGATEASIMPNMQIKVLIVEDEHKVAAQLSDALSTEGFLPSVCYRGDHALDLLRAEMFDAVVLDIMLPGGDGLSVVRTLRSRETSPPILLLSARGDAAEERIAGLNAGADDYMPKPFVIGEVAARLRALTRRGTDTRALTLRVADLTLDVMKRVAERDGRSMDLSTREFRLLEVLMRHAGKVCTRTMLLQEVWDYNFDPGTNLVDVYIRKLRDKIDYGAACPLLHTVRGTGYLIREPDAS